MPSSIADKISHSLATVNSSANQKRWANYILRNGIALKDLLVILDHGYKPATRFSWMLGELCQLNPEAVYPVIEPLFKGRKKIQVPNFERSLAKMMWLCGIPPKMEGKAADALFEWLLDPKSQVSVKVYSAYALARLALRYPDLKNELLTAMESQRANTTIAFSVCIRKVKKLLENKNKPD